MTAEYGLRSRYPNGATTVAVMSRAAAERLVAADQSAKVWHPVADAVVVRDVSDWRPVGGDKQGGAA